MTSYEAFASWVVGARVRVVFTVPDALPDPDMTRIGCAYRAWDGVLWIELHPWLRDDHKLRTFLHEVWHLVTRADVMRPVRDPSEKISLNNFIAVSREVNPALVPTLEAMLEADESEADRVAGRWFDLSIVLAGKDASVDAKLDCLIDAAMSGDLPLRP